MNHTPFNARSAQLAEAKENITCHFRYSSPSTIDTQNANHHSSGRISQEFLTQFITPETHIYFCGPKPMMQQINQTLKAIGHPDEQTHFEFFGPQEDLES